MTQYGILRAMGAEKGQLYFLVIAQILSLCALGIPLGLLLGSLSAKGILTAAVLLGGEAYRLVGDGVVPIVLRLTAATGMLSPEIFLVQDAGELNRLIEENSGGKGMLVSSRPTAPCRVMNTVMLITRDRTVIAVRPRLRFRFSQA